VDTTNIQQSDLDNTVRASPDCAPISAAIVLGPSTIQDGGARILGSFAPCILNDGSVALNLPDEEGLQLIVANIQGGQTTQSAIVPLTEVAPVTQGQTLFAVKLSGQVTGQDPATGNQVTMNGNINALFLRNGAGQDIELSGDNSIAYNALLIR
jgi:hypothetical protein